MSLGFGELMPVDLVDLQFFSEAACGVEVGAGRGVSGDDGW